MCGIIGILDPHGEAVKESLYEGLNMLQHRGQDSAGILSSDGVRVYLRKDNGLVRDVFHARHMTELRGSMGVAQVRYPTAGSDSRAEAQPFFVNAPFGIALAHNGNLTNAWDLRRSMFSGDFRHINTMSDSEVLLNVFAHELNGLLRKGQSSLAVGQVLEAVRRVYKRCRGGYAVVVMIVGFGILAFRDPFGIRPLVHGRNGDAHMFASESIAMDMVGYELERYVRPGEVIIVEKNGVVHKHTAVSNTRHTPCLFEFVYFSRPDSIVDATPVYRTRLRMGEKLGRKIQREWGGHKIDVVIPVPDTSRIAAVELAQVIGVKYREGLIKNRYIGRTFIMPGQVRQISVRRKLNPIDSEFRGRNVLLVDDSLVRGTTAREIVQMARDCGAARVYFASAAPPVRHPNVYGIDMPSTGELVAHDCSVEEVCEQIGADYLIYQDLPDLEKACAADNPDISGFDASCFNGHYVTGDVSNDYLAQVDAIRGKPENRDSRAQTLDLLEL